MKFGNALMFVCLAVFAALVLGGCGDSAFIITGGGDSGAGAVADSGAGGGGTETDSGTSKPRTRCIPGRFQASATCTDRCEAGFVPGTQCLPDGYAYSPCGCFPSGNGQPPPRGVCANGATRGDSSCAVCPMGFTAHETCVSEQWASCRCVQRAMGGTVCVGSSVTYNACAVCSANFRAQQMCRADGNGYEPCQCVPTGASVVCTAGATQSCQIPCPNGGNTAGTQTCVNNTWSGCLQNPGATCVGGNPVPICTANMSRACANACGNGGSMAGTDTCNSAGSAWSGCVNNAGAVCVGGVTIVCTAGATQSCTASCTNGGSAPGTQTCANNAWGSCAQNSGTVCSGGGSGGGCGGGTFTVRARNANLLVRCWGASGAWTSTGATLSASLDGNQCGYSECVVGTLATNGQFLEDNYFSNSSNSGRPTSEMFDLAGVTGRDARLTDTLGSSTMRTDSRGRIKAVFPVSPDCIGRGYTCS